MNWIKLKWTKNIENPAHSGRVGDWHKTYGMTLLNKVTFDYNELKMCSICQYGPPMVWIKLKWTNKNWKSRPQWAIVDLHKTEGFTLLNKVTFDYIGLKDLSNMLIWTTNELNKAEMDQKHWKSSPQWVSGRLTQNLRNDFVEQSNFWL